MKAPNQRRSFLMAAGAAAMAAGVASGQPPARLGALDYEGGKAIPAGIIEIVFEATTGNGQGRASPGATRLTSDGKARELAFPLPEPASAARSGKARIVAYLERADGWLLARGAARLDGDGPVRITLHGVIY